MKRIAIIGSSGAGKSTLSRQLSSLLALPITHLDKLYWQPNWQQTPTTEWKVLQQQYIQQDAWIIDGNYRNTMDMRLNLADTIIFMDFSRLRCLYHVLKRRVQYAGRARPDMNEQCPERVNWEFIQWVWNFPRDVRPGTLQKIQQYSAGREVIILRNPRQVKRFLKKLHSTMAN